MKSINNHRRPTINAKRLTWVKENGAIDASDLPGDFFGFGTFFHNRNFEFDVQSPRTGRIVRFRYAGANHQNDDLQFVIFHDTAGLGLSIIIVND
ncbi:MAG: hypothetical protein NUW00_04850 [Candidatus Kaiserbacteria bacterium]|nr:hypothetical protein [Candidatus Kaiserbacteria bacterium]MCR4330906.1 hypothetical protein [Patescibacteria group bacterium]